MATTTPKTPGVSFVEWSPIIAGTVLACAVSLVLLQFGNTLGLSIATEFDESYTAGKVLAIGLWLLWVQLMASASGAYLAGRMRGPFELATHESEMRDGAHGLLVWASSSLIAAVAAAIGAVLATIAAHHGIDVNAESETRTAITAEMAHRYTVIFGFGLAASSIVSAVAAWAMGVLGGDHRDSSAGASLNISFRRKTAKK